MQDKSLTHHRILSAQDTLPLLNIFGTVTEGTELKKSVKTLPRKEKFEIINHSRLTVLSIHE